MVVVHAVVFVLGGALVVSAPFSALRTFVVPRGVSDRLTRIVFVSMRHVFDLPVRRERSAARERTLAFYAPVALLPLPIVWLACVLLGYTAIFWALGASSWGVAFTISRLSLLYLGSDTGHLPAATVFAFSETVLSLLLAAILIPYLPTMYSAFSNARPPSPAWRHGLDPRPRPSRCSSATTTSRAWTISARPGPRGRHGSRSSRKATRRCNRSSSTAPRSPTAPGLRRPGPCSTRPRWSPQRWSGRAIRRPSCAFGRATCACSASPACLVSPTTPIPPRPTPSASRRPSSRRCARRLRARGCRSRGIASRRRATSPAGGSHLRPVSLAP